MKLLPICRSLFLVCLLFILSDCGETDLGGQLTLDSVEDISFIPGLSIEENFNTPSDFQEGALSNVQISGAGELQLERLVIGETGRLSISEEINLGPPTQVQFRNTYEDPVVLAYIPSRNNNESLDVRVNNVGSTGMEIFIEDPNADGISNPETVTYLVLEKGRHTFANGLVIEAGVLNTSNHHASPGGFGGDPVLFSQAFVSPPIVLHTLNTYNNGAFKSSVCDSVNTTQMTLAQETAQTSTPTAAEDIAWAAFSTGSGSLVDMNYVFKVEDNGNNQGVDNAPQDITYTGFVTAPDLIVKGASGGGADGYWMRGAGTWSSTNHDAFAEEDQVDDGERSHANESFQVAAFSPDSTIGIFETQGSFEIPTINLSKVKFVESSRVEWASQLEPGTNIVVESNLSLDGGLSWGGFKNLNSADSIPDLDGGEDVSNGLLKIRVTLLSSDEEITPVLENLQVVVEATQSLPN